MPRDTHELSARRALLFGGVAGSVAKSVVAPFDRVKIHFQVAHPQLAPYRGRVTGVFGALNMLHRRLGFAGLYRGHSATLARIFPYAAINYAAFEHFKRQLAPVVPGPWAKLLSGSLAGMVAVSLTYPFDIVRARVAYDLAQHSFHPKRSLRSGLVVEAIKQLRHESPRFWPAAFYQGFLPTIMGIVPYAGVSFFTFETLKQAAQAHLPEHAHLPLPAVFCCGLVAGALGQTCAYPLDVLRRRLQIFRVAQHLPAAHYSAGLASAFRAIIAEQGLFRGFFAGLSINYLKVAPASGISFLVYETLKRNFPEPKPKPKPKPK